MKKLLLGSALLFVTACASESSSSVDDAIADPEVDELSATQSCGANYKPALQKYELAVYTSKAILASGTCGEDVVHPKNKSLYAASIREEVEALILDSISQCSYFRQVYKTSVYAKPLRTVMTDSALRGLVDGSVNPSTMVGLEAALVGATMYGPKPGVMHLFTVNFKAGNVATFNSPNEETLKNEASNATYRVITGAKPQIEFTQGGLKSVYGIVYEPGSSLIEFAPVSSDDVQISSYSDPCSA